MENIYSIIISDFQEKIHFLFTKPDFELTDTLKISKSLNKSLCIGYLNDHASKNIEMRLMDTCINSQTKLKITILGEVIINMIYDSIIDINYINLVNQRLIEAIYNIAKTKKVKVEHLNKRYMDTCMILEDTVYMLDPRIRLMPKQDKNLKDMISVCLYI